MASEAKGNIVIPSWVNSGIVYPIVNDDGEIEVVQKTADDLQSGIAGYIDGAWQKQPLQFGYGEQYSEALGNAAAPAGVYTVSTTAVPANTVRVIDSASLINGTATRGLAFLYLASVTGSIYLVANAALPVNTPLLLPYRVVLSPTEKLTFQLYALVAGDIIIGGAHGYDFELDL